MSSRKTRNKIKSLSQSHQPNDRRQTNNMKGAYIITYVGKGVNHEKINNRRTQKRELDFAINEYSIDPETAKHLMNRFYRLNADLDRLSYLENDSTTCNKRSTKKLSLSCSKRIEKLNHDFNNYGLALDSFSHLMTIVIKGTTKQAISGFYY